MTDRRTDRQTDRQTDGWMDGLCLQTAAAFVMCFMEDDRISIKCLYFIKGLTLYD